MIDIWMIFTMTFPLLEVALHTYKEALKLKLNKFGVPYDVSSPPVLTKVQPMRPLNPIDSPKKVQRYDSKFKYPIQIFRTRLTSRMRFCEHLLDRVLPFAATGLFFTRPKPFEHKNMSQLIKFDTIFRIYCWFLCNWDHGSLQHRFTSLKLLLIDRKVPKIL